MKKYIRGYAIEIVAFIIVVVGIFLLVEQMDIRLAIRQMLINIIGLVRTGLLKLTQTIKDYMLNFTLSDAVGWLLIILAIAFILWRIRYRFLQSDKWLAITCPRCDSKILRAHRSRMDHFVGWIFLPKARRYQCSSEECDWSGLRRHGRRRRYMEQVGEPIDHYGTSDDNIH